MADGQWIVLKAATIPLKAALQWETFSLESQVYLVQWNGRQRLRKKDAHRSIREWKSSNKEQKLFLNKANKDKKNVIKIIFLLLQKIYRKI